MTSILFAVLHAPSLIYCKTAANSLQLWPYNPAMVIKVCGFIVLAVPQTMSTIMINVANNIIVNWWIGVISGAERGGGARLAERGVCHRA
jgi:hypothetical protein